MRNLNSFLTVIATVLAGIFFGGCLDLDPVNCVNEDECLAFVFVDNTELFDNCGNVVCQNEVECRLLVDPELGGTPYSLYSVQGGAVAAFCLAGTCQVQASRPVLWPECPMSRDVGDILRDVDVPDGGGLQDADVVTDGGADTTPDADVTTDVADVMDVADATDVADVMDVADTTDGSDTSSDADVTDAADVTDVTDATDVADVMDVADTTDGSDTSPDADVTDAADVTDVTDATDEADVMDVADTTDGGTDTTPDADVTDATDVTDVVDGGDTSTDTDVSVDPGIVRVTLDGPTLAFLTGRLGSPPNVQGADGSTFFIGGRLIEVGVDIPLTEVAGMEYSVEIGTYLTGGCLTQTFPEVCIPTTSETDGVCELRYPNLVSPQWSNSITVSGDTLSGGFTSRVPLRCATGIASELPATPAQFCRESTTLLDLGPEGLFCINSTGEAVSRCRDHREICGSSATSRSLGGGVYSVTITEWNSGTSRWDTRVIEIET